MAVQIVWKLQRQMENRDKIFRIEINRKLKMKYTFLLIHGNSDHIETSETDGN